MESLHSGQILVEPFGSTYIPSPEELSTGCLYCPEISDRASSDFVVASCTLASESSSFLSKKRNYVCIIKNNTILRVFFISLAYCTLCLLCFTGNSMMMSNWSDRLLVKLLWNSLNGIEYVHYWRRNVLYVVQDICCRKNIVNILLGRTHRCWYQNFSVHFSLSDHWASLLIHVNDVI